MSVDFLKKIGVVFNPEIEGAQNLAEKIAYKFERAGAVQVFSTSEKRNVETPAFVIVVGGDGTLLKAARYYAQFNIPIFGFNMGRLGFLAQAKPDEVDYVFEKISAGEFRIEDRIMLETFVDDVPHLALNDFVIKGATFSRTSTLELYINNSFVSGYLADGLIVSTPTGSTAYTLSAGGPVISPTLPCLTIVPICPHTLNARPLVVGANEKIRVKLKDEAGSAYKITADGQKGIEISHEVKIEKSDISAKLLLLNKDSFYTVLREKLHWGKAPEK